MPKVTVIQPTKRVVNSDIPVIQHKKRVAAYARVSTEFEEQQTSYEAQVDYYIKYIKSKPEWKFVDLYSDEGISATSTKNREGFKQMISDALDGKIDLILTKSVSRFARNTVDTLTYVRKLKDKGVEVYFEKENIFTLDSKGELLITIMSSLAQEESRSISENVTWGQRKRFADGKVSMPYKHFLGYKKGADGLPEIVPEQARTVRIIFRLFLEGKTPNGIADILTAQGIKTPAGKDKWSASTVKSILKNEKYKGDALLQKRFTTDFLTKKMKVNEGEVPKYYVEDSHPAIISPEIFDMVQAEFDKRKGQNYSGKSCFSGKIICGECGAFYGSKVWHSNDKYRCTIWQCNKKFEKGKKKCCTPHITEEQLKTAFIEVFNRRIKNKSTLMRTYKKIISELTNNKEIESEIETLISDQANIAERLRQLITENATGAMNHDEYETAYDEQSKRYEEIELKLQEIRTKMTERNTKKQRISEFLDCLDTHESLVKEFNEQDWLCVIDHVTVGEDGELRFVFKDGRKCYK